MTIEIYGVKGKHYMIYFYDLTTNLAPQFCFVNLRIPIIFLFCFAKSMKCFVYLGPSRVVFWKIPFSRVSLSLFFFFTVALRPNVDSALLQRKDYTVFSDRPQPKRRCTYCLILWSEQTPKS